MKLKPHNQAAYEEITKAFKTHRKVSTIRATGTGKSYIISRLCRDYEHVLFVAPSNSIHWQLIHTDPTINADMDTYCGLLLHDYSNKHYDLIVFDELHRAGAPTWEEGVRKVMEEHTCAKCFGCTATPVRCVDGRNMVDCLFDGVSVSNLSLIDAIEDGIINRPKYVRGLYDLGGITKSVGEKIKGKENLLQYYTDLKEKCLEWNSSGGVANIFKKHLTSDYRKGLVFFSHISELEKYRQQVTEWLPDYEVFSVHCKTRNIAKTLDAFKDCKKSCVMLCVDLLNEGLHVDDVSFVAFFRSTSSRIIYLQQIGRCLSVGKDFQPIIFDFVNNVGSAMRAMRSFNKIPGYTPSFDKEGYELISHFDVVDEVSDIVSIIKQIEDDTQRISYDENKIEFLSFCEKHSRLPNSTHGKYEQHLANFAIRYKDRDVQINECYQKYVRRPHPYTRQDVMNFLHNNKRCPNHRDNQRLYVVFNKLRKCDDEVKSLYLQYIQKRYTIDDVVAFCEDRGVLPSTSSQDKEERQLRNVYRFKLKQNHPVALSLKSQYAKRTTYKGKTLIELEDFCNTNGHLPSNKKGRKLYSFIRFHRQEPDVQSICSRFPLYADFLKAHNIKFKSDKK